MKFVNWKTTLFGLIGSLGVLMQTSHNEIVKNIGWFIVASGLFGVGANAKDKNVTGVGDTATTQRRIRKRKDGANAVPEGMEPVNLSGYGNKETAVRIGEERKAIAVLKREYDPYYYLAFSLQEIKDFEDSNYPKCGVSRYNLSFYHSL